MNESSPRSLAHAERIVKYVTESQGCKMTELAADVARLPSAVALSSWPSGSFLLQTIEDLVKSGRLVEVEYVLPDMPNVVKSFLLPSGTKVKVVQR